VWSPARSQLYAVLTRLSKDGLARRRRVAQQTRPDKQLYRITAAGRQALDGWLTTLEPDDDAFYLKLFVGGLTTDAVLVEQVERYRDRQKERVEELRALDRTNTRTGHDRYHGFLLDLGLERARDGVRWANRVLAELRR
jgi:DNA-binding PadR family transcriptional regulator